MVELSSQNNGYPLSLLKEISSACTIFPTVLLYSYLQNQSAAMIQDFLVYTGMLIFLRYLKFCLFLL